MIWIFFFLDAYVAKSIVYQILRNESFYLALRTFCFVFSWNLMVNVTMINFKSIFKLSQLLTNYSTTKSFPTFSFPPNNINNKLQCKTKYKIHYFYSSNITHLFYVFSVFAVFLFISQFIFFFPQKFWIYLCFTNFGFFFSQIYLKSF